MTSVDTHADLVPLRTGFDVVWRGYDAGQVRRYVERVETDLRLLTADRDAASARAEALARQLAEARAEADGLRARIDRICATPIDPEALTDRLRRMVELAREEATEITARARTAADQHWSAADQAAARLRGRYERLVAELDARRRDVEAEHRELLRRAHERIEAESRRAERARRERDERAAELRRQVEADFEIAMSARRAEAMAELARREAQARDRAEELVREATEHARRIVVEARGQVDDLRARRDQVAANLRAARELLAEADPCFGAQREEIPAQRAESAPVLAVAG